MSHKGWSQHISHRIEHIRVLPHLLMPVLLTFGEFTVQIWCYWSYTSPACYPSRFKVSSWRSVNRLCSRHLVPNHFITDHTRLATCFTDCLSTCNITIREQRKINRSWKIFMIRYSRQTIKLTVNGTRCTSPNLAHHLRPELVEVRKMSAQPHTYPKACSQAEASSHQAEMLHL